MPIVTAPETDIWQGDIYGLVPWAVVSSLEFVQPTGNPAKPYVAAPAPEAGGRRQLMTSAGRDMGMLITHECVVDKGERLLTFARVLSISSLRAGQEIHVRNLSNLQTFHLPAVENLFAESYVDFRLITVVSRDILTGLPKIASLTLEGRESLREQLIRYWTRRDEVF